MKYEELVDEGVVNRGNLFRLNKLLQRAKAGEKLCIGFIGGSITQGCVADKPQKSYAYLVYQWFINTFPDAELSYMNAGIGGTTSQFGVARVKDDLLEFKPDFIITEFSVNDDEEKEEARILETYEGLIRKCYYNDNKPAVIILNNVKYDNGENVQHLHNKVGDYYELPCISMKSAIYPLVRDGIIPAGELTPDNLHPNNEGHKLIAHIIIHFLNKVYCELSINDSEIKDRIPPITRNSYENALRFRNMDISPIMQGFVPDERPQEGITDPFKNGWFAGTLHSKIIFILPCTGIAIQYRKSRIKPTPVARVVIDDDVNSAVILDGNFDQDWGDCVYLQTVLEHAEYKKRKIEIELISTHKEDKVPFYLISIITT